MLFSDEKIGIIVENASKLFESVRNLANNY